MYVQWTFEGCNDKVKGKCRSYWKKKQKRPYNARLKVLCWKLSDSFVKVSGNEKSYYGRLYKERKELEVSRNESGAFKEICEEELKSKKRFSENQKETYEKGLLPKGRIDLRARRYVVKQFLSHYFEVCYIEEYQKEPPRPWIIDQGLHTDYVSHRDVIEWEK